MTRLDVWRPPDAARLVGFSPGLVRVAVLDDAGNVDVIDPFADGAARFELDLGAMRRLAVADDGSAFATVDAERRVRIVPTAAPADARELPDPCGAHLSRRYVPAPATESVEVASHDLVLAAGSDLALVTGRTLDDQEEYYGGGWITSTTRTTLWRWRAGTGEVLIADREVNPITYSSRDNEAIADHPIAAAFAPDGRSFGLLLRRGRLALRAAADGSQIRVDAGPIAAFAFFPDGGVVTASGAHLSVRGGEGRPQRELVVAGEPVALACSPCGGRLACLDRSGAVAVVDLASGATVAALAPEHAGSPRALAWSAAPLRILRGSDGALLAWHP